MQGNQLLIYMTSFLAQICDTLDIRPSNDALDIPSMFCDTVKRFGFAFASRAKALCPEFGVVLLAI